MRGRGDHGHPGDRRLLAMAAKRLGPWVEDPDEPLDRVGQAPPALVKAQAGPAARGRVTLGAEVLGGTPRLDSCGVRAVARGGQAFGPRRGRSYGYSASHSRLARACACTWPVPPTARRGRPPSRAPIARSARAARPVRASAHGESVVCDKGYAGAPTTDATPCRSSAAPAGSG